jgi:hypothetical protein
MPTAHRDVDREGRSAAAEAVVDGMGNKDRRQRAASGTDRRRLPDEVSRPVPPLEHAADRNGTPRRVQAVYGPPSPGFGTIVCLSEALDVPLHELAATWRGTDLPLEAAS